MPWIVICATLRISKNINCSRVKAPSYIPLMRPSVIKMCTF